MSLAVVALFLLGSLPRLRSWHRESRESSNTTARAASESNPRHGKNGTACTGRRPERRELLYEFLVTSFDPDDWKRLLYLMDLDEVGNGLNWDLPPSDFFLELVKSLERHNRLNHDLFERLKAERPKRTREIQDIMQLWCGDEIT
jgi:hypothetical protein